MKVIVQASDSAGQETLADPGHETRPVYDGAGPAPVPHDPSGYLPYLAPLGPDPVGRTTSVVQG